MSKPRIYGMQTKYVPNAKFDMHWHKKVYKHCREKVNMLAKVQKKEDQDGK